MIKRRFRPYPTAISGSTLDQGLRQIEMIRSAGFMLRGATVLEIGTGWQPLIPLLFALAGCRVITVDMQRLMDLATLTGTARNLAVHAPMIAKRLGLLEDEVREWLAGRRTATLADALNQYHMEYKAPFDVTNGQLADGLVDAVISRAVLEHVPPDILRPLLAGVFRIVRRGGLTCHVIDNSDHWSHKDKRLSRANFLRYSDRAFGLLCKFNPLDYQSRLRHCEYLEIFRDTGFEIVSETAEPESRALEELKTIPLAPRFRQMPPIELVKMDSYLLARKS